MKNKLIVALAAVSCLALTGCERSPKATAEKFMNSLVAGDTTAATKLCTKKTAPVVSFVAAAMEEEKSKGKKHNFVAVDETITGETAKVTIKDTEAEGKSDKVDLKKEDGEWKVHINK